VSIPEFFLQFAQVTLCSFLVGSFREIGKYNDSMGK